MTERQILHTRFLGFFKTLEEQGDLCSKPKSKLFKKLAKALEIDTNLLSKFLNSERNISFLHAYHFCSFTNLSFETMFQNIPNYLSKVIEEGGFKIESEQSVVGGSSIGVGLTYHYDITKNSTGKNIIKTKVINDSMAPQFCHGQEIQIRELTELSNLKDGNPYVIETETEGLRIKNVFISIKKEGLQFWLTSNNANYKPEIYSVSRIRKIYEIIHEKYDEIKSEVSLAESMRNRLKQMVASGKCLDVINIILKHIPENNNFIICKSRWERFGNQKNLGELDSREYNQNITQLEIAVLGFIEDLELQDLEKIRF